MVRNCDAVKYWLLYMKNVLQLSALTGNNTEAVLSKAEFYELSGGKYSYGAEMPLKGEAEVTSIMISAFDTNSCSFFL